MSEKFLQTISYTLFLSNEHYCSSFPKRTLKVKTLYLLKHIFNITKVFHWEKEKKKKKKRIISESSFWQNIFYNLCFGFYLLHQASSEFLIFFALGRNPNKYYSTLQK